MNERAWLRMLEQIAHSLKGIENELHEINRRRYVDDSARSREADGCD